MDSKTLAILAALGLGALVCFSGDDSPPKPLDPVPAPCPPDQPCPPKPKPRKPWGNQAGPVGPFGKISLGGPVAPDGLSEVQIDYPLNQRMGNIGSKVDGLGMCVSTSVEMSARCAGLDQMRGFRDYCANEPGGAGPSKMDRQIKAFCQAKGISVPIYVQYQGNDPAAVAMLLKTCRMPSVTYGGMDSVRYPNAIQHMVNAVSLTDKWACLLDNNETGRPGPVGENGLLWMTPNEFTERFRMGGGGWVFAWLTPPWPPVPSNR